MTADFIAICPEGSNMTNLQNEQWKLARLRPHEYQADVYPELAGNEFEELVANIRKEGLRVPLEILPDGRIIAGRHRYLAAKKLGWKTIPVVVRHDLAEAGDASICSRIVEDNLVRRQLSPLAQARALLKLKELNGLWPKNGLTDAEQAELRDQIGRRLGMSGRNAGRYLAVLRTPLPVQDLFERGKLPLNLAARVATLPPSAQGVIAEALQADPDASPAAIVQATLGARTSPGKMALGAYTKLLNDLRFGFDRLSEGVASIPRRALGFEWNLATLRSGRRLLKQLIEIEKEVIARQEEDGE